MSVNGSILTGIEQPTIHNWIIKFGTNSDFYKAPADTIHTWINEKRKDAKFVDPPNSRQHFDIWRARCGDVVLLCKAILRYLPDTPWPVRSVHWKAKQHLFDEE